MSIKFLTEYCEDTVLSRFSGLEHSLHGFFEVTKAKGSIDINLIWKFLENMYIKTLGQYKNINYVSESSLEAFYVNPQQQFRFLKSGGDVKVGQIWEYVLFS